MAQLLTYLRAPVRFINYFCMVFMITLCAIQLIQLIVAFFRIRSDNKKKFSDDYGRYAESRDLLPISILIPAYNEQENIVQNIRSLMKLNYPEFEIIVVNDGSTDRTHDLIIEAFGLKPIEYPIKMSVPTGEIRGVYCNTDYPNLVYIDKVNGGKSDALNAGINASRYPLFACLDADSRIERDSLLRLASEFMKDSTTVVAGGLVRIANGARIRDGRVEGFRMPKRMVERFQIVEYYRDFLSGRVSWGMSNSMLIVSGAFGVFQKQAVIAVGGYRTDTVGEDMEIVVRLHRHMRDNRKKYRIIFCQDAVCWTQGPMSVKDIRSQRRRWQIGLFDTLKAHISMLFNPKYQTVGLVAIPYHWIFELLGAPVELLGYFFIPLALILGELSLFGFLSFFILAALLGVSISVGSLILEQYTRRSIMTARQSIRLSVYAILENFGYRQMITLFRVEGMIKYRKLRRSWGKIGRREIEQ